MHESVCEEAAAEPEGPLSGLADTFMTWEGQGRHYIKLPPRSHKHTHQLLPLTSPLIAPSRCHSSAKGHIQIHRSPLYLLSLPRLVGIS